jgi:hypothetical protein
VKPAVKKDFAGSERSQTGRGFWQNRPWRLVWIWQHWYTGILGGAGMSEMAGNIGPGGVGGGGVFAGQPIFLIQSKIQISLYIWIYFRSICWDIVFCDGSQHSIVVLATL